MSRKTDERAPDDANAGPNEEMRYMVEFGRAPASRPPRFGVALFAQARGDTHGGGYEWGDVFHGLADMFKSDPQTAADPPPYEGEPFSTIGLIKCIHYTFNPEIPAGHRAMIEIEGNEQKKDPKYGAIEIFVTPDWVPGEWGKKPPGEPRLTFGGDGGCWVRGRGRLTVHLLTDIIPAPKITVRIEKLP